MVFAAQGSGEQHPSPWGDQVWFYLQATFLSLSVAMQYGSGSADGWQEKPSSILSTLASILVATNSPPLS